MKIQVELINYLQPITFNNLQVTMNFKTLRSVISIQILQTKETLATMDVVKRPCQNTNCILRIRVRTKICCHDRNNLSRTLIVNIGYKLICLSFYALDILITQKTPVAAGSLQLANKIR